MDDKTEHMLDLAIETNRRLNRRNQELEREIASLNKSVRAAVNKLHDESNRAHRYANLLRDIYRHRRDSDNYYWTKCKCCRFRRWFRFKIWNSMFAMKD